MSSRQLLGVVMLGLALSACSSTPIGSGSTDTSEEAAGSVRLPLVTKVGAIGYRLRNATFTIVGSALGGKAKVIKPLPDIEVHNEALPLGSYSINLEKGWILERLGPGDKDYVAIEAKLVTPNPLDFEVTGKAPADALFGFATTSGDVSFGSGSVNVHIGVQDCSLYDSYTASLGTLTANCLGTIDPRAYEIDADGFLVPRFSECVDGDPAKLRSIRQVLSLQHRSARLPFAKACLAGRYATSLAKFQETGTEVCPKWDFVRTENPITAEVIAKIEGQLPRLPSSDPLPPGILDGDRPALKTFNLYAVALDGTPNQSCRGASDCAQLCASTFPGFAVAISKTPDGREAILTDPDSWLETTVFATMSDDPYLRPTFYHPMSYFGGAPGVQFGDPHRAMPCGLDDKGVSICLPESCSYFTGLHRRTRLQLDCNDYSNADTCTSYCGPALPIPPEIPAL
jgi:hypothetical protein